MRTIYRYLIAFWINLILSLKWIKNISFYVKDFLKIKRDKLFPIYANYPCLHDKYNDWWIANWHYFHQDLLVASKIYKHNPDKHVDIWSRVDWFVAHLACFRKVEVFDIRNIENKVDNIEFKQADLMNLDESLINYTLSISCLHVIEHFWLWRYWDQIDINWHIKWLNNIYRILKEWWIFYFSTPIGEQRIEFNAHRVFSIKYLTEYFKRKYDVESFSYVDDEWDLHKNIDLNLGLENNFNCNFGCGIFELKKI